MKVAGGVGFRIRSAVIRNAPLVLHFLGLVPSAAVLLAGLAKAGAGLKGNVTQPFPLLLRQGGRPQGLGLRPPQDILTKTFQLFAVAAIQEFIVFPILCREFYRHNLLNFLQR